MNVKNLLKLWGGIVGVLAVMALLTLLFNQRQHSVSSQTATIEAPTTVVGSGYDGVVTEQFVTDGQRVAKGDKLFTITSTNLQQAVSLGARPKSTPAFEVSVADGTVTYLAVDDGYATGVVGLRGTYVNGGQALASLVSDGDRFVTASYRLSPSDYARVERGARVSVMLPNNQKVEGTAVGMSVATDGDAAVTDITVRADELNAAELGPLANRGTPVVAVLSLRDDGPLAGATDAMLGFLTKIGLR